MPPQPGIFAVPYAATHKSRGGAGLSAEVIDSSQQPIAGPSRMHGLGAVGEDPKRDKKRKEMAGRLGKEMNERRDDAARHYAESISDLHNAFVQLSTRPETLPAFALRLYPLTLERAARLTTIELEERHALANAQTAYEEERESVEKEWQVGRDRIRERLLEGIEERRRKAREEKDGDGTIGEGTLDPQSRQHNTRKLRNKIGTSPPPTPLSATANGMNGVTTNGAVTNGPFLDPLSLSVDELPSAYTLPLTSVRLHPASSTNANGGAGGTSRRRPKGQGKDPHSQQGLNKSVAFLVLTKDVETEADLGEIRRGNKRRRVAAGAMAGKA